MIIIYDTKDNTLSIDNKNNNSWGTDVIFAIERHGRTIRLKDLHFSVKIVADGATILDRTWPQDGMKLVKTNQDVLSSVRLNWLPEQLIQVTAWLSTPDKKTLTVTDSFTTQRPQHPDQDNDYIWDSDQKIWVKE